jgi:ubiquinone/menaquinone biosynthesis C-methylase UbiE
MSFDRLAPHYRWMESVAAGTLLQRCRTRFLDQLTSARHVLVLGPGRGRFVRPLLERNPRARLTLVDSSRRMLAFVRRDLARHGLSAGRVDLVHGDVRMLTWPPATFDAVASHFFLDCFAPRELDAVISRVARWTTSDARWVVSDFAMPDAGWKRRRAAAVHAAMYAFFGTVTGISARRLTPPDGSLSRAGFVLRERFSANLGLLHADLWSR